MNHPHGGSGTWGENRIFSIPWGSVEASGLCFVLDLRNGATRSGWGSYVTYEHQMTNLQNWAFMLNSGPKQLLQLINRYCLKSGDRSTGPQPPQLLPPSGTVIAVPYLPDNVTTWNVALLQQHQNLSEPFQQRGHLSSEPGASAPPLAKVILPSPDNLPNTQIVCSASTTTNISEPVCGTGVPVLKLGAFQHGHVPSEGASAPSLATFPSPDNLPHTQTVCSASTTTNISEPVCGTGVPVLKVPFDAVSSCPPITRRTLHLQPNFSEFFLEGRPPTSESAQPVSKHWLMPELPEEALASLPRSFCLVPSLILRRILQH